MSDSSNPESSEILQGKRVAFVGKLASMSKREAGRLVRRHGATVADNVDESVDLMAVGEDGLPIGDISDVDDLFGESTRRAAEEGSLEILTETELWHRLGLVELEQDIHRLYTPAMLAELLKVPVAVIRRWHRRGLIVPVREVRRLAYFDFQEVATARRLAELLAAGMSPRAIERKLESLSRLLPGVKRPLAQLSVIIQGKEILLRQGDGLIEPGGQLRFDFEASKNGDGPGLSAPQESADILSLAQQARSGQAMVSPDEMCRLAAELEEEGHLEAAAETYRAVAAATGPHPEICFQIAELLYRLGDSAGARERYYMTIEMDEDYVEARANLGCVLEETGQKELAVAAFEGALACHPDYADVHYHLARTLEELDRAGEAQAHWQAFLDLAPDSPWADQARARLSN
jgi:tetratricopeptide (TPR) repeat protein